MGFHGVTDIFVVYQLTLVKTGNKYRGYKPITTTVITYLRSWPQVVCMRNTVYGGRFLLIIT